MSRSSWGEESFDDEDEEIGRAVSVTVGSLDFEGARLGGGERGGDILGYQLRKLVRLFCFGEHGRGYIDDICALDKLFRCVIKYVQAGHRYTLTGRGLCVRLDE